MAHTCPSNGTDYHGRCLGACRECDTHLESTGRYTVYCPSCDTCPTCGCPNADGFSHYADCKDCGQCENCNDPYLISESGADTPDRFCSDVCEAQDAQDAILNRCPDDCGATGCVYCDPAMTEGDE